MIGLPPIVALLLAFAMMLSARSWPGCYAAQCVAIAVMAVTIAVLAGDPWAAVSAVVLAAQAVVVPRLLPAIPRGSLPGAIPALCGAGLLTVLAGSVTLADGFAVPLSILLIGLLGAALARDAADMRFGVLLLLNGAAMSVCLAPASALPVTVLAAMAVVVASGGVPRLSALR